MIQIYICEDEKIQLEFWKRTIEEYIKSAKIMAEIVSARQNPQDILNDIEQCDNSQRLFFIDIQMPEYDMNGLELARKLREKNSNDYLVFITAKDDLAYKVFEYQLDVLDYIVKKPKYYLKNADMALLTERLNRIFYKINQDQKETEQKKIQLGSGSRKYNIAIEDIIYVQAVNGTHLVEINIACKKIQVRQTLKEIAEQIDMGEFLFVNKSCIVQKRMILSVDKKNRRVNLTGGYLVEINIACKKIQVRQTLKEIAEQIDMGEFLFVNKSCIVQKRMILSVDKKNRRVNLTGGYQVEVAVREMKKVCTEAERLGIRNAVHI